MKKVILSIVGIVAVFGVMFILGLYNLGMFKFFAPKYENVRREVFENTKSYTHGKIQDLAKYYEEYNKAETTDDKETIRQIILVRFAEFDETKIKAEKLKNFLVSMRGY